MILDLMLATALLELIELSCISFAADVAVLGS